MTALTTYQTMDGATHQTAQAAQSHALANAARMLRELIEHSCPGTNDAKPIADKLVLSMCCNGNKRDAFATVLAWVDDSATPESAE